MAPRSNPPGRNNNNRAGGAPGPSRQVLAVQNPGRVQRQAPRPAPLQMPPNQRRNLPPPGAYGHGAAQQYQQVPPPHSAPPAPQQGGWNGPPSGNDFQGGQPQAVQQQQLGPAPPYPGPSPVGAQDQTFRPGPPVRAAARRGHNGGNGHGHYHFGPYDPNDDDAGDNYSDDSDDSDDDFDQLPDGYVLDLVELLSRRTYRRGPNRFRGRNPSIIERRLGQLAVQVAADHALGHPLARQLVEAGNYPIQPLNYTQDQLANLQQAAQLQRGQPPLAAQAPAAQPQARPPPQGQTQLAPPPQRGHSRSASGSGQIAQAVCPNCQQVHPIPHPPQSFQGPPPQNVQGPPPQHVQAPPPPQHVQAPPPPQNVQAPPQNVQVNGPIDPRDRQVIPLVQFFPVGSPAVNGRLTFTRNGVTTVLDVVISGPGLNQLVGPNMPGQPVQMAGPGPAPQQGGQQNRPQQQQSNNNGPVGAGGPSRAPMPPSQQGRGPALAPAPTTASTLSVPAQSGAITQRRASAPTAPDLPTAATAQTQTRPQASTSAATATASSGPSNPPPNTTETIRISSGRSSGSQESTSDSDDDRPLAAVRRGRPGRGRGGTNNGKGRAD